AAIRDHRFLLGTKRDAHQTGHGGGQRVRGERSRLPSDTAAGLPGQLYTKVRLTRAAEFTRRFSFFGAAAEESARPKKLRARPALSGKLARCQGSRERGVAQLVANSLSAASTAWSWPSTWTFF